MPEKIKVMIVDDENIVVEDLKDLIDWEKSGYTIVATASNGKKALQLYEQFRPSIILADIKMPVMDGIEMSRKILSVDKSVKIFLLTAYKDFEYARQALEIGVVNYLVKYELDSEKLLRELAKAKDGLHNERKGLTMQMQQMLVSFVRKGDLARNELRENASLFEYYGDKFILMTMQTDNPYYIVSADYETPNIQFNELIKSISSLEYINYSVSVELNSNRCLLLFMTNKKLSQKEVWESLYPVAVRLQTYAKERYGASISIVLGKETEPLIELPKKCKEIVRAAPYNIFYGREKIFTTENIAKDIKQDIKSCQSLFDNLEKSLNSSDNDQICQNIKAMQHCVSRPLFDLYYFNEICIKLVDMLEQIRAKNGLCTLSEYVNGNKAALDSWFSVTDIFNWFQEEFKKSIDVEARIVTSQYSRIVKQACQIIHKNYSKDLSVESVSEELNISGVWLSKCMKKETGTTFLEYLTNYRIVKAKEFLLNSDNKIYEIAELVGYKTSQYFSQTFSKLVGVSPFEYREGRTNNEIKVKY